MKKIFLKYLILQVSCVIAFHCHAQFLNLDWAGQMGGPGAYVSASDITTDLSGNVITVGSFQGTADFDPGPGSFFLSSSGITNVFISKTDSLGNFLWAKQLKSISSCGASAVIADKYGNIFVTGTFNDTLDADPGPAALTFTTVSPGWTKSFVLKLTASGNFACAGDFGGRGSCGAASLLLDSMQNVYISGRFSGPSVDFDPGPAEHLVSSMEIYSRITYESGFFLLKLDAAGNFVSVNADTGGESTIQAAINPPGEIVTLQTVTSVYSYYSEYHFSILKYAASGLKLWSKDFSNAGGINGLDITLDSSNNVYAIGSFYGTKDFNPGPATYKLTAPSNALFILKLSASGDFIWVKQIDIDPYYYPNPSELRLSVDGPGNLYISGSFSGTVDFDPGSLVFNQSAPNGSGFILKLKPSGDFLWAQQIPNSITYLDSQGTVYAAGTFSGICSFNGIGNSAALICLGNYDALACKMRPTGILAVSTPKIYENKPFAIYPNPTLNKINLDFADKLSAPTFKLLDISGKVIMTWAYPGAYQYVLDLSGIATGFYVLEVSDNNLHLKTRLVKE